MKYTDQNSSLEWRMKLQQSGLSLIMQGNQGSISGLIPGPVPILPATELPDLLLPSITEELKTDILGFRAFSRGGEGRKQCGEISSVCVCLMAMCFSSFMQPFIHLGRHSFNTVLSNSELYLRTLNELIGASTYNRAWITSL